MTAVDDPEGRLPDPDHFERRVPQGDDRSRLVCRDCGFVAYENPKIVVGSVAAWQGRILLCRRARSEEHTSELQSLMRLSYAVYCLKKNNKQPHHYDLIDQHRNPADDRTAHR